MIMHFQLSKIVLLLQKIPTMNHEHITTNHTEKRINYIPIVFTATVLALIAIFLLHNFHGGGNIWVKKEKTEAHKSQDKE